MTAEIVPFKTPNSRHISGMAMCLGCKHEWLAVVPVGTTELECPACTTHKGMFKYPYAPASDQEAFCCVGCGGMLFYFMKNAKLFCPTCGHYLEP